MDLLKEKMIICELCESLVESDKKLDSVEEENVDIGHYQELVSKRSIYLTLI